MELVKLQLDPNDWYVRHARRLLQERAANKSWNGESVHERLAGIVNSVKTGVPERHRALSGQRRCQGSRFDEGGQLPFIQPLVGSERVCSRLEHPIALRGGRSGRSRAGQDGRTRARDDPSPVVRLYLAAALQRLPWVAGGPLPKNSCRTRRTRSTRTCRSWTGMPSSRLFRPTRCDDGAGCQLENPSRSPIHRPAAIENAIEKKTKTGSSIGS